MALSGLGQLIAQDVKYNTNNGLSTLQEINNYYSGNSNNNSGYNSVAPGQSVQNTAPISDYQYTQDEIPEAVANAQKNLNLRSLPSQDYANQVQADIITDYQGFIFEKSQFFRLISRHRTSRPNP